jgi:hypothetical protein
VQTLFSDAFSVVYLKHLTMEKTLHSFSNTRNYSLCSKI